MDTTTARTVAMKKTVLVVRRIFDSVVVHACAVLFRPT